MMANIEAETCGFWQLRKTPVANISRVWLYFRLTSLRFHQQNRDVSPQNKSVGFVGRGKHTEMTPDTVRIAAPRMRMTCRRRKYLFRIVVVRSAGSQFASERVAHVRAIMNLCYCAVISSWRLHCLHTLIKMYASPTLFFDTLVTC